MTDRERPPSFVAPPERLGPYRILQVLGEGGMGVVYEAEQTAPVRRRVALKVVRTGLATHDVIARFEAERQALAVMDHPGIAKVVDAGATELGQPYFAMELVKGLPLTEYCDARRLSTRQRLELFVAICHAVQHAHQKGVIHRDLKPSNVLVTESDGGPAPKIIDFGIAKAIGQQLTEKTLVTRLGQAIGTAAYMSPEQAEASGLDVDTRADIYSLGVMLYELLVGRLPVDPAALGVHAFMAQLVMGETNAPAPSTRFGSMGNERAAVAHTRNTDPDHLANELRGDLDWIVLKAMAPDRTHRYETANGLAVDIQRYLHDEPVVARPPSMRYRVGKFVRRHRAMVAAGVVAASALVLGGVGATVGMLRATRAERSARQEAAVAREVTDFLVRLFTASNPGTSRARADSISARQLLDSGAARVTRELAGQPVLQGRIMYTIGTVYDALGVYPQGRSMLEQALAVRQRTLGPNAPEVAQTLDALGEVARLQGDYAASERAFLRALAIDSTAPARLRVGRFDSTLAGLAALRATQGRLPAAESLYVHLLTLDDSLPAAARDTARARHLNGLAVTYYYQKHYPLAAQYMERALALQQHIYGPNSFDAATTMNNLGGLYWQEARYADALPVWDSARAIFAHTVGPEHPYVAAILTNLGEVDWKLKRYADADSLLRRSLAIKERIYSPDNPSLAETLNALAGSLRDQGRYAEAEPLYRRALAIREKAFGPNNPDLVATLKDYAELLRRMGRPRDAAAIERHIPGTH